MELVQREVRLIHPPPEEGIQVVDEVEDVPGHLYRIGTSPELFKDLLLGEVETRTETVVDRFGVFRKPLEKVADETQGICEVTLLELEVVGLAVEEHVVWEPEKPDLEQFHQRRFVLLLLCACDPDLKEPPVLGDPLGRKEDHHPERFDEPAVICKFSFDQAVQSGLRLPEFLHLLVCGLEVVPAFGRGVAGFGRPLFVECVVAVGAPASDGGIEFAVGLEKGGCCKRHPDLHQFDRGCDVDSGLALLLPFHPAGDLAGAAEELQVSGPVAGVKDPVGDRVYELVVNLVRDGDAGIVEDSDDVPEESGKVIVYGSGVGVYV